MCNAYHSGTSTALTILANDYDADNCTGKSGPENSEGNRGWNFCSQHDDDMKGGSGLDKNSPSTLGDGESERVYLRPLSNSGSRVLDVGLRTGWPE
jgi:hypothetical protein